MATHRVNLDALIRREDFESGGDSSGTQGREPIFKAEELERGRMYYGLLRKPDFQRTTDNWSPDMIVEFVRSFLDDELIPSIIIWHSKKTNKVFVIDGAHRISALLAWVNDDYGYGEISKGFFGEDVPAAQQKLDRQTRELMEQKVGTYSKLHRFGINSELTEDQTAIRRGRAIVTRIPDLQRVEGDAEIAQKSFLKINSNPAIIDATELDIIKARHKPNAIATRALIQAGKGHQYWSRFPNASEISALADDIHDLLFGKNVEIGTQSPDVPRAGQPYSPEAFKMVLDMVNVFNDITDAMWQDQRAGSRTAKSVVKLEDDTDGTQTLKFLERIKRVALLITHNEYSGSLGLDQAVYSYGVTGKFHTAAFLASMKFAMELKAQNKTRKFTQVREGFEEFLVRHKSFINQIGHSKGSRTRSLESLMTMHRTVMESLLNGVRDDNEIIAKLKETPKLAELSAPQSEDTSPAQKRFSKSVVAAAVVRDILKSRNKCNLCGARVPPFARSKDHIIPLKDGGTGTLDNLQFTHPYCNSIKEGDSQ